MSGLRALRPDPVACDCCHKPLKQVYGTFHRAEREYGWASLPFVICGECSLAHRGGFSEQDVAQWVLTRAARAGSEWQRAVNRLVTGCDMEPTGCDIGVTGRDRA